MSGINLPRVVLKNKPRTPLVLGGATEELIAKIASVAGVSANKGLIKKINAALMSDITPELLEELISKKIVDVTRPELEKSTFWNKVSFYISITSNLSEVRVLLDSKFSFKEIVKLNEEKKLDIEAIKFINRFG